MIAGTRTPYRPNVAGSSSAARGAGRDRKSPRVRRRTMTRSETLPLGAARKSVVDGQSEVLAVPDVGGRVVIVRAEAERVEGGEGRVDPDTDGSEPLAASSRKLATFASTLISSLVFQLRPVLLK